MDPIRNPKFLQEWDEHIWDVVESSPIWTRAFSEYDSTALT